MGCACEALVQLLVDRGTPDDLREAHRVVEQPPAASALPGMRLWWLRARVRLARAEGNWNSHTELARQYLTLCERLDARGRLAEARDLVDTRR